MTDPYIVIPAALLLGYLFGSIPFGLIITKIAGTQDLRSVGSGNIGATNVLRTGRKGLAAATLISDLMKGTIAVLIAARFGGPNAAMAAGLGAVLGHLYPAWLGFKGGKGVATYIGVLLALFWPAAVAFCAIWLAVAVIFRYSSAAALVASLVVPLMLYFSQHETLAVLFAFLTMLIWLKHRPNIERLMEGTEGKIGTKS